MSFFPALHGLAAAIKQALQIPDDGTYSWLINQDSPERYWRLNGARWTNSPTGDDFTSTDKTFNQGYWVRRDYNVQGSTSEIVNNKLELTVTSDVSNAALNYWSTTSGFVGDFDVELEFEDFTRANANLIYLLFVAHIDGTLYDVGPLQEANSNRLWRTTFPSFQSYARTGDDGKMRITRVGTTLTAYTDHTGSWTQRASTTVGTTPCYFDIRLWSWNTAPGLAEAKIVNFTINSHNGFVPYYMIDSNETVANGMSRSFVAKNPGAVEATGLLFNDTNKAVTFDGVDQYARQGVSHLPMTDSQGTVELWVRFNSDFNTKSAGQIMFSVCKEGFSDDRFAIWADSDGQFRFYFSPSGGSNTLNLYSLGDYLEHDQTYHIVVTSDGSTVRMFLNGFEQSTDVSTGTNSGQWLADMAAPTGVFLMAQDQGSPTGFTDGTADELAYYSRALTPLEIFNHWRRGADLTPTIYGDEVEADSPIAWWRLDDVSNTAYDQIGTYHGTIVGTIVKNPLPLVAGGKGCFDFNGSSYVNIDLAAADVAAATSLTIEFWFRSTVTSMVAYGEAVVSGHTGSSGNVFILRHGLNTTNTTSGVGRVSFSEYIGGETHRDAVATGLADGAPHHVVLTWTGTSIDFYIDGQFDSTHTVTGSWNSTIAKLSIGQEWDGGTPSNYFNGLVDEVAIYTTELSDTRILAHYNAGIAIAYKDFIYTAQPIAYWKLDETSGTTAIDELGNYDLDYQNSPTLGAPAIVNGGGTAVDFDGSTHHALLTTADWRIADTQGSFELWITPDAPGTGWQTIIQSCDTATTNYVFNIGMVDVSGLVSFQIRENGTDIINFYSTTALTQDEQYHIVVTSDGSTIKMYINGVEETLSIQAGTNSGQWLDDCTNRDNLAFGALIRTSTASYFDGTLDEVAYYDYPLSQAQVTAHYNAGYFAPVAAVASFTDAMSASTPYAWWRMDDASGTLTDSSGNARDITTVNDAPSYQRAGLVDPAASYSTQWDGAADYATIPFSITNWPAASMEAWIRTDEFPLGTDYLGQRHVFNFGDGFYMMIDQSGRLHCGAHDGDEYIWGAYSSFLVEVGQTYHMVWTYDSSTRVGTLYLDGKEHARYQTPTSQGTITEQSAWRYLGNGNATRFWKGAIDEVAIYDRELSYDEVQKHYIYGGGDAFTPYWKQVMDLSPAAYWRFNDSSNQTVATDAVGTTTGTYSSTSIPGTLSIVPGNNRSRCAEFNGTDQNVAISEVAALLGTGAFSICAWIRCDGTTDAAFVIFDHAATAATDGSNLYFAIESLSMPDTEYGRLRMGYNNSYRSTTIDIRDGLVHFVCATIPDGGTVGDTKIYIDGQEVEVYGDYNLSVAKNTLTGTSVIGSSALPPSWFNGAISDLSLHTIELTAEQIASLYAEGIGGAYEHITSPYLPLVYFRGEVVEAYPWAMWDNARGDAANVIGNDRGVSLGEIGSMVFDGATHLELGMDQVDVQLNGAAAVTMELWYKPTELAKVDGGGEAHQLIAAPINGLSTGFGLSVSGYSIYAGGRSQSADSWQSGSAYSPIPLNSWTHLAAVIDYTNDEVRIYVNGFLVSTSAVSFGSNNWVYGTPTANMMIGANVQSFDRKPKGELREVAVYGLALPDATILEHARRTVPEDDIDYDSIILADKPIGYWKLDNYSQFSDYSGNDHHGWAEGDPYYNNRILHVPMDGADGGTSFTESVGPYAVNRIGNTHTETDKFVCGTSSGYFDGAGDYLYFGNQTPFDLSNSPMTVECWFCIEVYQTTGLWGTLVAQHSGTTGWRLLYDDYERLHFSTDAGATNGFFTPAGSISANKWYHVAATYDPVTQESVCFIDGKKVITKTGCSWTHNTTNLKIGSTDGSNWFHEGWIDDLKIYNVVKYEDDFNPRAFTDRHNISQTGLTTGIAPRTGDEAIYFDGTTNAAITAWLGNQQYKSAEELTLEAWAKRDTTTTGTWKTIIARYGSNDDKRMWWIGLNTENRFTLIVATGTGTTKLMRMETDDVFSDTDLHHYVATYARGHVRLYVDGVERTIFQDHDGSTWPLSILDKPEVPITFGGHHNPAVGDTVSNWDGTIQNALVFDKALTPREVYGHWAGISSDTPFADEVMKDFPHTYIPFDDLPEQSQSTLGFTYYTTFKDRKGERINEGMWGWVWGNPRADGKGVSMRVNDYTNYFFSPRFVVTGDYDIVVQHSVVTMDDDTDRFFVKVYDFGTGDSFTIYREHLNDRTVGTNGTTYDYDNSMAQPYWFRIERVGSTVRLYWKVNTGDSWTQRSVFTDIAGNPDMLLQIYTGGDNCHYFVNEITITADGYKMLPNWHNYGEQPYNAYNWVGETVPAFSTARLTNDKRGSVYFDGTANSEVINLRFLARSYYTGATAYMLWHAFTADPPGTAVGLVGKGRRGESYGGHNLVYNTTSGIQFLVDDGTTQVLANQSLDAALANEGLPPNGVQTLGVGVYDRGKHYVDVWQDGVLLDRVSSGALGNFPAGGSNHGWIGAYEFSEAGGMTNYMQGFMSDLVVYDYNPLPGRIRQYYEAGVRETHQSCIMNLRPDFYLPMTEDNGTRVVDHSIKGTDSGTLTGTVTFYTGRLAPNQPASERSFKFDGSTSYITFDSSALNNWNTSTTGEFTVSLLFVIDEQAGSYQELLSFGDDGFFRIYYEDTNERIVAEVQRSDNSYVQPYSYTKTIQRKRAYHLVATYSLAAGTFKMYINGRKVAQNATNLAPKDAGASFPATLGKYSSSATNWFAGRMQHVALWQHVLRERFIEDLYLTTGLDDIGGDFEYAHFPLDQAGGDNIWCQNIKAGYTHHATGYNLNYRAKPLRSGSKGSMYLTGESSSTSYVEMPITTGMESLYSANFYGIECWVQIPHYPKGTGAAWNACYMVVGQEGYHNGIYIGDNGGVSASHWSITGPTNWIVGSGGVSLIPGKTYHLRSMVDKQAGEIHLWINGSPVGTGSFTSEAPRVNTNPWRIGVAIPNSTVDYAWPFKGYIEGVKFDRNHVDNRTVQREYRKAVGYDGSYLMATEELCSVTDFTFDDAGDPMPLPDFHFVKDGKLDPEHWLYSVTGDGQVEEHCVLDVEGDKIAMQFSHDGTTASGSVYMLPTHFLRGDFDFEISISDYVRAGDSGASNYMYCYFGGALASYVALYQDNGTVSFYGNLSSGAATAHHTRTNNYGKIRMVRSGTTITAYCKDGDEENWTQISTYASASTDDTAFSIQCQVNGSVVCAAGCKWHDLKISCDYTYRYRSVRSDMQGSLLERIKNQFVEYREDNVVVHRHMPYVDGPFAGSKGIRLDAGRKAALVVGNTRHNYWSQGVKALSIWFMPSRTSNVDGGRLVCKDSAGLATETYAGWCTGYEGSTQRAYFFQRFSDGSTSLTTNLWYTPKWAVKPDQWNHFVISYSASSDTNQPTMYLNGLLVRPEQTLTATPGHTVHDDSGAQLWIGNNDNTNVSIPDRHFDGVMGPVSFMANAPSSEKVMEMYRMAEGQGPVWDAIADLGPSFWWRMNDTGDTLRDEVNRANGTYWETPVHHIQAPSDALITAPEFQSANSHHAYIDISSVLAEFSRATFTVSFWIVLSDTDGGEIINQANTSKYSWGIRVDPTLNQLEALQWDSSGAQYRQTDLTTIDLQQGVPYHVAVYFSADVCKIYIDGFLADSSTATSGTWNTTSDQSFYIGKRGDDGGDGQMDMVISDIAYFSRELNYREVLQLYEATRHDIYARGWHSHPIMAWNMETKKGGPLESIRDTRERGTTTLVNGPFDRDYTTPAPLKSDYAIKFNGTDQYTTVADSSRFDIEQVSIEMVIKTNSNHGSGQGADAMWLCQNDTTYNWGLLENASGGSVQFYARNTNGVYATGPANIPTGQWVHVVGTYDGGGRLNLFVNGHRIRYTRGSIATSADLTTNAGQLVMGSYNAKFIDGSIALSRIYDRALGVGEIKMLASKALDGYSHFNKILELNPAAYWRLSELVNTSESPYLATGGGTVNGTYTGSPSPDIWGPHYDSDDPIGGMYMNGSSYFSAGWKGLGGNQWTLSVWIRIQEANPTIDQAIVEWGDENTTGGRVYFVISNEATDQPGHLLFGVAGGSIVTMNHWNDGMWHHVVLVCGETVRNSKIFVDGVLDTDPSYASNDQGINIDADSSGDDFSVGAANVTPGATLYATGSFGDVALFDYRLTDDQVAELYGTPIADSYSKIVKEVLYKDRPPSNHDDTGYWPMQECHGRSTIHDASWKDYNGDYQTVTRGGQFPTLVVRDYEHEVLSDDPVHYWPLTDGYAAVTDDLVDDNGYFDIFKYGDADIYEYKFTREGLYIKVGSSATLTADNTLWVTPGNSLSGDYDVQVEFTDFNLSNQDDCMLSLYSIALDNDAGAYIEARRSGGTNRFWGSAGGGAFQQSRSNTFGGLRIARVGSTTTIYRKDGSGSYSSLANSTGAGTGPVCVGIRLLVDSSTTSARSVDAYVHDYTHNSGTVAYHGTWKDGAPWGRALFGIGANHGGTPAVQRSGTSAIFDGTDDYITAGYFTTESVFSDTQGSIECWFRIDPAATGGGVLVCLGGNESGSDWQRVVMGVSFTASLQPYLIYTNGGTENRMDVTTAIIPGKWYHMAATSTGAQYYIYLNGRPQNLVVTSGSNNGNWIGDCTSPANRFTIGAVYSNISNNETTAHWQGEIAHVAYYSQHHPTYQWARHYAYKKDTYPVAPTGSRRYAEFHGGDDNDIDLNNVLVFNTSIGYTLGGWVYVDPDCPTNATIVDLNGSSGGNGTYRLQLSGSHNNRVRFTMLISSQNKSLYSNVLPFSLEGAWHHIIATHYVGAPELSRIYVDGKNVGGVWDSDATGTPIAGGNPLRIGARSVDQLYPFVGAMQHIMVHGRYMENKNITDLALSRKSYFETVRDLDPYLYYALDDVGGDDTNKVVVGYGTKSGTRNAIYDDKLGLGGPSLLPSGEAQSFDCQNTYRLEADTLSQNVDFDDSPELTICFWAVPDPQSSAYSPYVMYEQNPRSETFRIFTYNSGANIDFSVYQGGLQDAATVYVDKLRPHFFTFVYNATTGWQKIYLNGEFYSERQLTNPFVGWEPTNELHIGGCLSFYAPNNELTQQIQNVAFFTKELTEDEIYSLYAAAHDVDPQRDLARSYEQYAQWFYTVWTKGSSPRNLAKDATFVNTDYAWTVEGDPTLGGAGSLPAVHFGPNQRYWWTDNTAFEVGSSTQFTIEAVVKVGKDCTTYVAGHSDAYCTRGWHLGHNEAKQRMTARFRDTAGTSVYLYSQVGSVPIDTWVHVAMTIDKDTDEGIIYVNGVAGPTADLSGLTSTMSPSQPMMIGAQYYDNQVQYAEDVSFAYFGVRKDYWITTSSAHGRYVRLKAAIDDANGEG